MNAPRLVLTATPRDHLGDRPVKFVIGDFQLPADCGTNFPHGYVRRARGACLLAKLVERIERALTPWSAAPPAYGRWRRGVVNTRSTPEPQRVWRRSVI